jgi:hypothetical protein
MLKTEMPRPGGAGQGRYRAAFEWAASTISRLHRRLKLDRDRRDARVHPILEAVIIAQQKEGGR